MWLPLPVMALPDWQSPEGLDAEHLGQVLNTRTGEWVGAEQLVAALADQPAVLLGEKHDNPDHQALQLWLLQALQSEREQASLVMEMLRSEQQLQLDQWQGQPLPDDPALPEKLGWQGWDWSAYGELVRWGLTYPERLLASNLSRDEIQAAYHEPERLDTSRYSPEAREELGRVMQRSHCDKLPEERLPAMLAIQQARDQRMASVLSAADTPGLLVAGAFHVRKDLGVPLHWPAAVAEPVVVMLVEAGSDLPHADQADWVWLTAAQPEQDYCAQLR
ncbi:MAG: iron(III) ABC transporter [Pseudomonadaceae bacterium]|nr:MAG: iron(III) ABC transporter [Pseudomonadaceae bacterium]